MLETDPISLISRTSTAREKAGFSLGNETKPAAADPRPVLMWLAGAGYRPKDVARRKGMAPTPTGTEAAADRLLDAVKPDDPVLAAQMRADTLVDLHRDALQDPRVQDIFDADPVLAADPHTGWLVTESMLAARVGLFDSLNTLLQKPYLTDAMCEDMRQTLIGAFTDLSSDSQREWCYSEVRLEQGLAFLESRQPSELLTLADELRPIDANRGIWDAVRLFSLAAQMSDMNRSSNAAVSNLLGTDTSHAA